MQVTHPARYTLQHRRDTIHMRTSTIVSVAFQDCGPPVGTDGTTATVLRIDVDRCISPATEKS